MKINICSLKEEGVLNFNGSGFTEICRYALAGLVSMLIDVATIALCFEVLGAVYWLAVLIGFLAGLGTAYALSVAYVFKGYERLTRRSELTVFLLVGVIGIGLNEIIIVGLVEAYSTDLWLAKSASILAVTAFNFTAKKYLLFNKIRIKNNQYKTV